MIYLGQSSLTINHATIDGNKEEYPTTAQLIAIYGAPTLTINEGAKICNQGGYFIQQMTTNSSGSGSVVTMNGGEIYNIDATNTNSKAVIYQILTISQQSNQMEKQNKLQRQKIIQIQLNIQKFQ